jgi:N utilization substance protein B
MATPRRIVREKVMQALYAHEISDEPLDKITSEIFEDIKKDMNGHQFALSIIDKLSTNKQEIDNLIMHDIDNWGFERLAIIDKIVLRIAITELLFFPDIPPKVTINEAIEVVKKYSTDKSGLFINGILDAIYIKMKEQHKIEKHGRGLIDEKPTIKK